MNIFGRPYSKAEEDVYFVTPRGIGEQQAMSSEQIAEQNEITRKEYDGASRFRVKLGKSGKYVVGEKKMTMGLYISDWSYETIFEADNLNRAKMFIEEYKKFPIYLD